MLLEPPAPHVHIGSYGDELLSWNSSDGSYATVDRLSDVSIPAYESFGDLIEEHLGRHLVKWPRSERRNY